MNRDSCNCSYLTIFSTELRSFSKHVSAQRQYVKLNYLLSHKDQNFGVCKQAYCVANHCSSRYLDKLISDIKNKVVSNERPFNQKAHASDDQLESAERLLKSQEIPMSKTEKSFMRLSSSYVEQTAAAWLLNWISLVSEQQPNSRTDNEIQLDRVDKKLIWDVSSNRCD